VFRLIAAERAVSPVRVLCRALGVSASGFYAAYGRPPSPRAQLDTTLRQRLRVEAAAARHTYGSPRLHRCLQAAGHAVGRKRVIRLMRAEGLHARRRRRFRRTTQSAHDQPIAPNHLARGFRVQRPNQVWAADLTYLETAEGWLYLAVVLDLYARRIVGWATRATLATELPLAALQMALVQRRPAGGGLHHSDRGLQYASAAYRAVLARHGWRASMSGTGNCYDNAVVESFFGSLKRDLDVDQWPSRDAAHAAVRDYIERFYNPVRLHSTLHYQSPVSFEAQV
jgi:putative transposase